MTRSRMLGGVLVTIAVALAGCSAGGEDPEESAERGAESTPSTVVRERPAGIAIAAGECMLADRTGVAPRMAEVVACEGEHDAEVYAVTAVEEQTDVELRKACEAALPAAYRDVVLGRSYVLTSPAGFVFDQGPIVAGDEAFCVYVHADPVAGRKLP